MNIDKFKHQHLDSIERLRAGSHEGVAENADEIAFQSVATSRVLRTSYQRIRREDRECYPAIASGAPSPA